ncbi:hypothetical protein K435DRAFT_845312 [Dendrothele bispora CBS 962.96]|uniref:Mid2 domain-containing protein n=1 Tax=Dendrothele bispora (strain CBS 962.96) TaxID=1314807 RepID=A0A4S8KVD3_DENBC|nr:hypothetical protein K435DRAFT_846674 [Dendrothele bispora CBS 962.96]THU79876.1 hypothetical protein K435DRAFT_845312 [Dendrothele bispora CBS 962.96]
MPTGNRLVQKNGVVVLARRVTPQPTGMGDEYCSTSVYCNYWPTFYNQLDSTVGIFIIPDGDNVDAVVERLASDRTTNWNHYFVDKNSHSGTLSLMVAQPGHRVFYFGGYTANVSGLVGGINDSDNNGDGKARSKKARQLHLPPIQELGRSDLVTAVAAKSPNPTSPSEETQSTSIQTPLSSPDTSTPLGNSISSTQEQQASLTPGPNSTSPATPTANRHTKGEIIGGIVGGVVFLAFVLALLWIWMKKRQRDQSRERDDPKPTSIVQVPQGPGIVPYSPGSSTNHVADTSIVSLNPHKRSTNPPQQNPPVSTGRDQNDELVSRLRWGNLKLQQRPATRGGHRLWQQSDSELEEHRRRVRVHEDSGWRMGQQDVASNDLNEMELEVPPDYTEA